MASKLSRLVDDELDAIRLTGGPGRAAKPSAFKAEVAEAHQEMLKLIKDGKSLNDVWYGIKATAANTVEVIARELRKAGKQLNETLTDDAKVRVVVRPRKDHPKLGDFVGWQVVPSPVDGEQESK